MRADHHAVPSRPLRMALGFDRKVRTSQAGPAHPHLTSLAGSRDDWLNTHDAVGLVVGTVAATPLQFSVAVSPGQYLQLDDVVVTQRSLSGQEPIQVSGVVTNVEAVHEGARFA